VLDRVVSWFRQYHAFGWTTVAVVATSAVTIAAGLALIVAMPADFFLADKAPPRAWQRHPVLRVILRMAKNLAGILLFVAGVVMALPLVPGPGVLFMLIGLGLVDFPGKRALERRLLGIPRVLASINRLRARFGKPPLATDPRPGARAP
jgi:hypothetical protein